MEKLYESNLVGRRGPPLPRCISRLFWLKNAFSLSYSTLNSEEIKVVRYAHRFQKTHFVLKKGDPYQEIKSQIFEGFCQFLSFEFEQNANFWKCSVTLRGTIFFQVIACQPCSFMMTSNAQVVQSCKKMNKGRVLGSQRLPFF